MSSDHNDGMNHDIREKLRLMASRPLTGATGTFPDGKLTPNDEGGIQFSVGEKQGNVIVNFGTPVVWLGMTPQEAIALGEAIINKAMRVANKLGQAVNVSLTG